MKLSATEKRIYALAQKWAAIPYPKGMDNWYANHEDKGKKAATRACGRALLKLFKERE